MSNSIGDAEHALMNHLTKQLLVMKKIEIAIMSVSLFFSFLFFALYFLLPYHTRSFMRPADTHTNLPHARPGSHVVGTLVAALRMP